MPIRQQYFIAAAIISLIGVMAVFAMFDFLSDESRYAEQVAMQSQGAMAQAARPYSRTLGANAFGNPWCANCGWRGAGAGNGICPNCRVFLRNPGVGVPPMSGQNAAFTPGLNMCRNCGWQGMGAGNGICPNCRVFLRNPGAGAPPMRGQNAGFNWFRRQEVRSARPRGILYCPVCDFAMSSRRNAAPNSIRCPRCPAYLTSSDAAANVAGGSVGVGQQAGWRPNCPLP